MAESPQDERQQGESRPKSPEQLVIGALHRAAGGISSEKLSARRQALAKQRRSIVDTETMEVVEFLLGGDAFGFELQRMSEVSPLVGVTAIPGSPSFVLGVINLRGQIVPIIDLRMLIGIEANGPIVFNKGLIFRQGRLVVGFLADEVIGAKKVPISQLQYSVGMLCGADAAFVKAVSTERLIILDADKVLGDPRLNPKSSSI
jgi:purine-binding chemotaxis protein CheW